MKKIIMISAVMFSAIACYDDSKVWDSILEHESRISELEVRCSEINANIASLSKIIGALQDNDYVTSVSKLNENGKVVGYTISFSKSGPVVIYHGKDGSDGKNGQNGSDGEDGYTPVVSVEKGEDGMYYWTLDGNWLLGDDGDRIPATGSDGEDGTDAITPEFKIEEGYWYVSYDEGATWCMLGKAVGEDGQSGEDGQDGDSFFKSVEQDEDNLYLTLADGSVFTLPLVSSNLVGRMETVTYVPGYEDGEAVFVKTYDENKGYAQLDFILAPAKVVAELDSCWTDLLKFRCVETATKAVNFIDLEIVSFESDPENGSFTIKVSGEKLSDEFFKGKKSYSAALFISNGDNEISSAFFNLAAVEGENRPKTGLSKPYLSWGDGMDKVKEYMTEFELTYSDKTTLIYEGMKSEHIISYEFEDDKLVVAAMYVEEGMSTIEEIMTFFEGYQTLDEYDGTSGEFASSALDTYAEVCKAEKSGVTYWFIGWSEYDVD